MTELSEIRRRLDALEQRVDVLEDGQSQGRRAAELFAAVDRDVADLKDAFRAQRHVLQALRDTQVEQGRVLLEHGQALGAIIVTLDGVQQAQQSMQETQQSMQETQQSMLDEMRSMKQTLAEHGGRLAEHSQTLAAHGRILARLDPGEGPDS